MSTEPLPSIGTAEALQALEQEKLIVPSDIDIAQSVTPIPISYVAQRAGILPHELELHGEAKAKVRLSILNRLKSLPGGNTWW